MSVDFDHAGDYRVFADFTPDGGDGMTLSADVRVAGSYDPRPLPAAAAVTTVDGYTVSLEGAAHAGQTSKLTLSVSLDGIPVTDLQPYLAAYGHLVALRASDLAYLHVHPDGHPGDGVTPAGPAITFYANMPSAEDYRLFLDFKHGEVVRTAEFTLTADNATTPGAEHSSHGAPRALKPNAFRSNGKTGMGNRHASICSCRSEMRGDVRSDCSARQRKSKSLRTSPR